MLVDINEQFNGRDGETATFLDTSSVTCNLRAAVPPHVIPAVLTITHHTSLISSAGSV